jgi:hypothetical protein
MTDQECREWVKAKRRKDKLKKAAEELLAAARFAVPLIEKMLPNDDAEQAGRMLRCAIFSATGE